MVGLAAQNIDRAACEIIFSGVIGEQRPDVGIGNEPSRRVALKGRWNERISKLLSVPLS
jgi:hypothetical protein